MRTAVATYQCEFFLLHRLPEINQSFSSQWFEGYSELASFEGMHSFLTSNLRNVTEVVGLEGRGYNVKKAECIKAHSEKENVSFFISNFESGDITQYGQFDVVFSADLLYYLSQPWLLIEQVSKVISTSFYQPTTVSMALLRGKAISGNCTKNMDLLTTQSGLAEESFWPTYKELTRMLIQYGFHIKKAHHISNYINRPLVNLLCTKQ